MNQAYVVGHITVKDEDKWKQYQARVPATLAPWGAELVFRGQREAVFAGPMPHTDIVVIRFANAAAAAGWFASAAYQALLSLRGEAADVLLVSYRSGAAFVSPG